MKQKFLLIVIPIFLCTYLHTLAQEPIYNWAKGFISNGASNISQGRAVVTDAAGNVYSTGAFQGTVDFDPGAGTANITSLGLGDIYILKQDASGNLLWVKSIGGTGSDIGNGIAVDAAGNIFITGGFNNTADFDPSTGTVNLTSAGTNDIFIVRLDASGNYVWAKTIGGTSADFANGIVLDAASNIYITGGFANTTDFDPGAGTANLTSVGGNEIFIAKFNASGSYIWAKAMGSTFNDIGYGITLDASGNIYTTGYFSNTADFDPSAGTANLTSAGGTDIFITKLDASGNYLWAKGMGGTGADFGYGITTDASGNIYATGSFSSAADFDPSASTANLTSVGNTDIFIAKLDASGNYLWAKGMGGTSADIGYGITSDASGSIYATGSFSGTADFDPNASTANVTSGGGTDIFIAKLDASGNYLWGKGIGGTSNDIGHSIHLDASNNIYTSGRFAATVDFDPSTGTANLAAVGIADIYTAKYNQCSNNNLLATVNSAANNTFYATDQTSYFASNTCSLISAVKATGANILNGNVTAKVWIEAIQPVQFVKRHYEITPATNATTATGKVTLYFTQQEFTDFNTVNTLKLPTGTADATGKSNLRIEKRSGTSSNGTGNINTYGTASTIDPVDADIIWNATASRWEVSFDVTGFSGFFVKTQTGLLPLNLLSFTGTKNNNGNLLEWKTANEINAKSFIIERSNDGINFIGIGKVHALGNGNGNYNFLNADKFDAVVYYRLKMIDVDGRFTYSNIIKLSTLNLQLSTLYPNPIKDKATLQIGDKTLLNTQANIIDVNGKKIKTFTIRNNFEIVDMSGLPSGLYMLKMGNGETLKIIKQ
jgi:Secretion system C-terminal sorting domain/Beta-propeller repeat